VKSPEFTGLRVIGSRYSRDTFRNPRFLAKNRVLFTWLDLEGDPGSDQLLQQFGVTELKRLSLPARIVWSSQSVESRVG